MINIFNRTGYYLLTLITLFSSFGILHNANWIIGDNIMFIIGSAIGKNNLMMYGIGRFFPLAFQEFNVLNYIPGGNSPLAHYIISIISFYALILTLSVFYAKLISEKLERNGLRSWLVCFFVLLYFFNISFLSMFMDIIYPERMVLLCYSLFILTYWQGLKSGKNIWFVLAALISVLNMFYKEPVFGSMLVFVAVICLFNLKNLTKGQKIFNGLIILGSLGFLLSYYFVVYRYTTHFYNEGHYYDNLGDFIRPIFEWNRLFYIYIVLGIYRAWKLVFRHDKSQIFTDALLYSGLSYMGAYILLNLNLVYYFLPVYILCMPALITFTLKILNRNMWFGLLCLLIFGASFYGYFIHVKGAIYMYQYKRQTDMAFMKTIADKYKNGKEIIWYQVNNKLPKNQFANFSASDRLNKLEKFLAFTLNGTEPKITKISVLKEQLYPNQFLIYPPENEIEQEPDFSVLGHHVTCSKEHSYFYYCEYIK